MSDFSAVFTRRHPLVHQYQSVWNRCRDAYSGGREYLEHALIKHVSEVSLEFEERKQRAYYFNYPRKVARIIAQFLLAETPQRTHADPALIEDFSRSGLRTGEVMRQVATYINCFGMAWLLVDMPRFSGELDLSRKQREGIRPYARALNPWEVADWAYAPDGRLAWALVDEWSIDRSDPFTTPEPRRRRRLWTRDNWQLFRQEADGRVTLEETATHRLGEVPLIRCEEADGFGMHANHWFEDVVRISDAILNAESEAQMNIIKQMFGLLVVSESFRAADFSSRDTAEGEKFSHVLARSAALWESPEEKGITRYISPGGTSTEAIRNEITNLKRELFDVVGLGVQHDSDVAQTAEAKAWDHYNVSQFLLSRVDMLEQAEAKAWELMHRWDPSVPVPFVSYNREFSIVDLKDSIAALLNLNAFAPTGEFRREVSRAALKLLARIKKIAPEVQARIEAEIAAGTPSDAA
ncbi:MAG: hypothetical protein PHQ27_00835 [Victivallales bacterium]|nr:hypothetical protein [Victivallales bacterium]